MKHRVYQVAFVILLVVYGGYCAFVQKEFSQGIESFQENNFLDAWEAFESVSTFYRFALPSRLDEAMLMKDQSSLLYSGDKAENESEYEFAIDSYETFLALYPYSENATSIENLLPPLYLEYGITLRDNAKFNMAIDTFGIAYQRYPDAIPIELVKTEVAQTYLDWGDNLVVSDEYHDAIGIYETRLTLLASEDEQRKARMLIGETYLKWGEYLREEKQPEAALQKYELFLANYGDLSIVENAYVEIPLTLLEWAQILNDDVQFEQEVEVLNRVIEDFENTAEAEKAKEMLALAYQSIGQKMFDEDAYILAMRSFEAALEFSESLDDDMQAALSEDYENVFQVLASDTGEEGQQVLSETLEVACAMRAATFPVVGSFDDGSGKGMFCDSYLSMPEKLLPSVPGEFDYVVLVEKSKYDLYYPCNYSGGYRLVKQVNEIVVTVRSALTGEEIDSHRFTGSSPSCPGTYTFTVGKYTSYLSGGPVDVDEVVDWVRSIFSE